MKREGVAALIIFALIMLCVWNTGRIDRLSGQMLELLDSSEKSADTGHTDKALSDARRALDIWLQADGYTHIFIRHCEIDGTSDAFYELLSSIDSGDTESLHYAYGKLRYHIDSITGMEHVSPGSIL